MNNESKLPLFPIFVGLMICVMLGSVGMKAREQLRISQGVLSAAGAKLDVAKRDLAAKTDLLAARTAKLAKVEAFLDKWAPVYRAGAERVGKPGMFTLYTNKLTEGSGVSRQKVEPAREVDDSYIAVGSTVVPARVWNLEFTGQYEPLLRVLGTMEQDFDLAAFSRVDFRITDKHISCAYTFAYPALPGLSGTPEANK